MITNRASAWPASRRIAIIAIITFIAVALLGANVAAAFALQTYAPHAPFASRLAVAILATAAARRLLAAVFKAVLIPALRSLNEVLAIKVAQLEARAR